MKKGCFFIFAIWGLIALVIVIFQDTSIPPKVDIEPFPYEKEPDTTREVDTFDWKSLKYVYKDSHKKIPEKETYTNHEPYPDFFIYTPKEKRTRTSERIILMEGKKYRIETLENGQIRLIKLR